MNQKTSLEFIAMCLTLFCLFAYGIYAQRKENLNRWTTKDVKNEFKRINKLK